MYVGLVDDKSSVADLMCIRWCDLEDWTGEVSSAVIFVIRLRIARLPTTTTHLIPSNIDDATFLTPSRIAHATSHSITHCPRHFSFHHTMPTPLFIPSHNAHDTFFTSSPIPDDHNAFPTTLLHTLIYAHDRLFISLHIAHNNDTIITPPHMARDHRLPVLQHIVHDHDTVLLHQPFPTTAIHFSLNHPVPTTITRFSLHHSFPQLQHSPHSTIHFHNHNTLLTPP
ncbi:hypothetical protein AVEN_208369-1, partial [Araneus ventricosus]